jgi:hypothetical protein
MNKRLIAYAAAAVALTLSAACPTLAQTQLKWAHVYETN